MSDAPRMIRLATALTLLFAGGVAAALALRLATGAPDLKTALARARATPVGEPEPALVALPAPAAACRAPRLRHALIWLADRACAPPAAEPVPTARAVAAPR